MERKHQNLTWASDAHQLAALGGMTLQDLVLSALLASGTIAFLLAVAILVEHLSALEPTGFMERIPGAIFVIALPAIMTFLIWPLSLAWNALGVPPIISLRSLHPVAAGIIMLLAFDLLRYWEHRFEHRFWWPIHAVHHSPTRLHAANAFAHPLQAVPEFFLVTVPLSLVDTGGPGVPLAVALTVSFQNLVIHSPLRVHFGPLRRVVVDSRFHRIHHSTHADHHDRNFGIVFSWWDRLFGTLHEPRRNEWPAVGLAVAPARDLKSYLTMPIEIFRGQRTDSFNSISKPKEPEPGGMHIS